MNKSFFCMTALPLLAAPSFTPKDAVMLEWQRDVPQAILHMAPQLKGEEAARLALSLQRIGKPLANGELPAVVEKEVKSPTAAYWEKQATLAKTPEERYWTLHFLNCLKSTKALVALETLTSQEAQAWPQALQLPLQVGRAQAQGCVLTEPVQKALAALRAAGKLDPVREQAARMRLVAMGLEKSPLPVVEVTPGGLLHILQSWTQGPWEARKGLQAECIEALHAQDIKRFPWGKLGMKPASSKVFADSRWGLLSLLLSTIPAENQGPEITKVCSAFFKSLDPTVPGFAPDHLAVLESLKHFTCPESLALAQKAAKASDPRVRLVILPVLRARAPKDADLLQQAFLVGDDGVCRGAAIDDMAQCPAPEASAPLRMEQLLKTVWKQEELDSAQALLKAVVERWKLPLDVQKEILAHFLEHPCWAIRREAFVKRYALDAKTPWPTLPQAVPGEKSLLDKALTLASHPAPQRVKVTFADKRQVVIKLDTANAPVNVANFLQHVEKGWYNGRRIGRVVPDFVVQMGSPYDTMEGGSAFTVRCEDSLKPYGPGSVGMALSGKDTGSCQIFITLNATPHLTGLYTRLGEVEDLPTAMPLLGTLALGAKIEKMEVMK